MLATITAALMMFYAAATAQAKDMVRRIHDATIALVSLDRQMIGRLAYVVVPDFMYLEYRSLYLELKPFRDFHGRVPPIVREPVASGAAVAGRPPHPAARRDDSPHHTARRDASPHHTARRDASPHHAAVTVDDLQRAVEEVKPTVRKAKREIIEDAHTARASEADNRRVPTGERSDQIAAVRKLVREARASGKKMSILRACRAVWRDVNGGYPSPEALYDYCHSHRAEF